MGRHRGPPWAGSPAAQVRPSRAAPVSSHETAAGVRAAPTRTGAGALMVSWKWAFLAPGSVTSRAENRIHVVLMLALGAANLAILVRGPSEGPLPAAQAARSAIAEPLLEASRPEIDAGIQRLKSWLTDAGDGAVGGPEQALALQ